MSARWNIDGMFGKDVKSAARHFVLPLVAGGAVAGLQAAQSGVFDLTTMKGAAITSIIAGVIRLLQRFTTDMPTGP